MSDAGCKRPNTTVVLPNPANAAIRIQTLSDWYRVKVESLGSEIVVGCRGRLVSITKGAVDQLGGESPSFPFAPHEKEDALSKSIYPDVPEYLDVLVITEANQVLLVLREVSDGSPIDWGAIFSEPEEYRIRIAVVTSNARPATIDLLFKWTGNRETSEMSCLTAN
jgi:hypothetical protein